jgi:hypothetical protein
MGAITLVAGELMFTQIEEWSKFSVLIARYFFTIAFSIWPRGIVLPKGVENVI